MSDTQIAGARGSRARDVSLFGTLPGRAIVVGVAIKLLVSLLRLSSAAGASAFVGVVDTVAGLAIAAGAAYCCFGCSRSRNGGSCGACGAS